MFISKTFDEQLIAAFEVYNQKMCDSLPKEQELEHITFSDEFERKMQKLIRVQKKSYFYLINTVGKKVAIILLTLFISLTAATIGVKAIRETVVNFITETFDKFTQIIVENKETPEQVEFIKTSPQYLPEGYTVESELDSGGIYQIIYSNEEGNRIDYYQEFYYGNIRSINTEKIVCENLIINNYAGIFFNNGINSIVFADEKYMYTVYGNVSKDELLKIAESIKIK